MLISETTTGFLCFQNHQKKKILKDLNSIIFNFIWSGKPDKISRNTIIGDYEKGGLRMIHIPSVITGLKGTSAFS